MAHNSFIKFISNKLKEISKKNQFRRIETCYRKEKNMVFKNGNNLISFSCNDYLSLSTNSQVKKASNDATLKYGTGAGSSRLITGNNPLYSKLEKKIASIKNMEACTVFGSGYLAVLGIISSLVKKNDLIVLDEYSHSCAFLGAKASGAKILIFSHNKTMNLEKILEKYRHRYEKCMIVTEGVFSMDGDLAPVKKIIEIKNKFDAILLLDDAHGFGITENEKKIGKSVKKTNGVDIYIGTLSKAVGSYGGYACAKKVIIDFIVNRCRTQIYTTGLPPSVIAASLKALEIINKNNSLFKTPINNANYFCKKMNMKNTGTPIVPLIVKSETRAVNISNFLLKNGLLVSAIRPPTVPQNTSRLRLAFNSSHSIKQIDKLVSNLKKALILYEK